MIDLKEFRRVNNLLQKDVADYIGVSRGYIAMVESGKANLPHRQVCKLLKNAQGWDTSMLIEESTINGDVIQSNGMNSVGKIVADSELLSLRRENEILLKQIAELKEQNERYWQMIEKLTNKQ